MKPEKVDKKETTPQVHWLLTVASKVFTFRDAAAVAYVYTEVASCTGICKERPLEDVR